MQKTPKARFIIAADKESQTGVLVQALDQARLAGVANVSIAAFSQ